MLAEIDLTPEFLARYQALLEGHDLAAAAPPPGPGAAPPPAVDPAELSEARAHLSETRARLSEAYARCESLTGEVERLRAGVEGLRVEKARLEDEVRSLRAAPPPPTAETEAIERLRAENRTLARDLKSSRARSLEATERFEQDVMRERARAEEAVERAGWAKHELAVIQRQLQDSRRKAP